MSCYISWSWLKISPGRYRSSSGIWELGLESSQKPAYAVHMECEECQQFSFCLMLSKCPFPPNLMVTKIYWVVNEKEKTMLERLCASFRHQWTFPVQIRCYSLKILRRQQWHAVYEQASDCAKWLRKLSSFLLWWEVYYDTKINYGPYLEICSHEKCLKSVLFYITKAKFSLVDH